MIPAVSSASSWSICLSQRMSPWSTSTMTAHANTCAGRLRCHMARPCSATLKWHGSRSRSCRTTRRIGMAGACPSSFQDLLSRYASLHSMSFTYQTCHLSMHVMCLHVMRFASMHRPLMCTRNTSRARSLCTTHSIAMLFHFLPYILSLWRRPPHQA